jgi:biotin-(acetyl-CoA carboxylase) ligase
MKIYILLNHVPTEEQVKDLRQNGFNEFIEPTDHIKKIWSNIDPYLNEMSRNKLASIIIDEILENKANAVWIQGENGMVFSIVSILLSYGINCYYATSKREVNEVQMPDGVQKTSIFRHVQFLKYTL